MVSLHKNYLAVTISPAKPTLKWRFISTLGFTTQQAVGTLTSLDVSSFISVEKKKEKINQKFGYCAILSMYEISSSWENLTKKLVIPRD